MAAPRMARWHFWEPAPAAARPRKRKFWFAALAAALVLLLGAESDLPCTVEEDELSFTLDFAPAGEEAPVLIRLIPREN